MTSLIRADALRAFDTAATAVGLDARAELERVGLPPSVLQSPDNFIAYQSFVRLLENAAAASARPDFGLLMAKAQSVNLEGPLTLLMRYASTLAHASQLAQRYTYIFSPEVRSFVIPDAHDPRRTEITLILSPIRKQSCVQATEHVLARVLYIMRWITGGWFRPAFILLPHQPQGSTAQYAQHLDCEVRFGARFAAIGVNTEDLVRPLPQRNALQVQMAIAYIEQNFGGGSTLITHRVRIQLRQSLAEGRVTLADVAATMDMHPKTLQRRMAADGHRFDAMLEDVRKDLFLELVTQPAPPPLAHTAQLLGYSEQAALSRSCKRWFGCSPSALRNGVLAEPPAATGPGA